MRRVDIRKIRKLRKEKKLTQKYMAEKLGYKTDIGYYYLESGRCQIKAHHLSVIAEELGVNVEDLYEDHTTEAVGI